MPRGRDNTPDEPKHGRRTSKRDLANQHRLMALGDAVDQQSSSGPGRRGKRAKPRRTRRRRVIKTLLFTALALVVIVAGVIVGGYWYANKQFKAIPTVHVSHEVTAISGQPFNILLIGSDSRAGLTGLTAAQTGATQDDVSGERSDVVKVVHVDPINGTISMVSIPRDTMVTLLKNQSLYGNYNRINVNLASGPSLVAQTITADFGIPIHQTIVVSFAGLINAADALGGVYLDFPYPSWDPYSGLRILHPGCQLIQGFQALALTRSRHFYYNNTHAKFFPPTTASYDTLYNEGWVYDGTSDFGRIDRQNAFLRAMVDQAKHLYNPLTILHFLSKLPQGVTLDSTITLHELLGLAVRFHSINANAIQTYTLPTVSGVSSELGDVLYVDQPYAQEQLVGIFGNELTTPTNPPPNVDGQTPEPPVITTTTTLATTTTAAKSTGKKHGTTTSTSTTTTTNPTLAVPSFDPVPCTPS